MNSSRRPVITIVGGGFAGTVLAVQLARQGLAELADVYLVEPRPVPGPGLAYTARRAEYLLNVRSGSLSLYPDQPEHFTAWLRQQPEAAEVVPEFASRVSYGRYLQEELAAVLAASTAQGQGIRWLNSTAVAALPGPEGRSRVQLANGQVIPSDFVVLALGNFPPPPPAGPDLQYLSHSGYHADAWATGNLRRIGPDESVLLIGSGLTAVDVLLALRQDGHRAPVTVVARHGRWPAAHGPADVSYPNFYSELARETTVRGVVKIVTRHIRAAAGRGLDWRPVLDALRPDLGRIWSAWPLAEQRWFLHHLAGLWAVARHRSPPQNAAAVEALTAAGLVQLQLGQVKEIVGAGEELRVHVRTAKNPETWLTACHVVNCTGPLLDYSRIQIPLVVQLREAGCLRPDSLGLGMLTDEHGALLDLEGKPSKVFFTLGASRRPAYFESTAVPEIRQQAEALANKLRQSIQ